MVCIGASQLGLAAATLRTTFSPPFGARLVPSSSEPRFERPLLSLSNKPSLTRKFCLGCIAANRQTEGEAFGLNPPSLDSEGGEVARYRETGEGDAVTLRSFGYKRVIRAVMPIAKFTSRICSPRGCRSKGKGEASRGRARRSFEAKTGRVYEAR